jgi:hypothetical protein
MSYLNIYEGRDPKLICPVNGQRCDVSNESELSYKEQWVIIRIKSTYMCDDNLSDL